MGDSNLDLFREKLQNATSETTTQEIIGWIEPIGLNFSKKMLSICDESENPAAKRIGDTIKKISILVDSGSCWTIGRIVDEIREKCDENGNKDYTIDIGIELTEREKPINEKEYYHL